MERAEELRVSWKAGTLRQQELQSAVETLLRFARHNLDAGRMEAAGDYLELASLVAPQSVEAMQLRGALAAAEGRSRVSAAYKAIASWL